jgi:antitoxin component of MazEF toxin-antitoxin module
MKTKLRRIEGHFAVVLDEPDVEALGLNEDSEIEVSRTGRVLVMRPASDAAIQQILDELDEQYGSVFERLSK